MCFFFKRERKDKNESELMGGSIQTRRIMKQGKRKEAKNRSWGGEGGVTASTSFRSSCAETNQSSLQGLM